MTQGPVLGSIVGAAEELQPWVVDIRRRLHRRPEIGLDLPETQRLVVEELERLGLAPKPGRRLSSVTAFIDGASPGPTVLLRADMDALPITEATGLPFASEVRGAMHACGHDTHIAMLLGAARLLLDRRGDLRGRVLLVFQPGEEGHEGARIMLGEGVLEPVAGVDGGFGPVGAAFAIHSMGNFAAGTINLKPGPQLASADMFTITVRGRGGHASTPYLAVDPVAIAAEIVTAIQVAVTRRVDIFDPAVVTIASIAAGSTPNVIPDSAFMQGTARAFSAGGRERVLVAIREVAEGIAAAHGGTAEVAFLVGFGVTSNDPELAALVQSVAAELVGPDRAPPLAKPLMVADDFSDFSERVPGVMAFLGGRPPGLDPAAAPHNHSDLVVFDESALPVGVALNAAVALRFLLGT